MSFARSPSREKVVTTRTSPASSGVSGVSAQPASTATASAAPAKLLSFIFLLLVSLHRFGRGAGTRGVRAQRSRGRGVESAAAAGHRAGAEPGKRERGCEKRREHEHDRGPGGQVEPVTEVQPD